MTIGDKLRGNFPKTLNKSGTVFSSIVANNKQTGVFETLLNDFIAFSQQWTSSPDVYQQTGEMLKLTTKFITYFEQYTDETEEAFTKRIRTIFVRNGSQVFGGPYDVQNVFKEYFPSARIYLVENVNDKSLNKLYDGDFQEKSNRWVGISDDETSNCFYDRESRFSKSYGITLKENGSFYQKVALDISDKDPYTSQENDTFSKIAKLYYGAEEKAKYIKENNPDVEEPIPSNTKITIPALNVMFLHFFLIGECNITITDKNGKYWNPEVSFDTISGTWTIGKWQDKECLINKKSANWKDQSVFFIADNTLDEVTINFIGTSVDSSIDYVRLFEKQPYPSFAIIAHFDSFNEQDAAAYFPGNEDSAITPQLENGSYYDKDFFSGVANGGYAQDLYEDLLEYVRAIGVKAYIEIVNRDS